MQQSDGISYGVFRDTIQSSQPMRLRTYLSPVAELRNSQQFTAKKRAVFWESVINPYAVTELSSYNSDQYTACFTRPSSLSALNAPQLVCIEKLFRSIMGDKHVVAFRERGNDRRVKGGVNFTSDHASVFSKVVAGKRLTLQLQRIVSAWNRWKQESSTPHCNIRSNCNSHTARVIENTVHQI